MREFIAPNLFLLLLKEITRRKLINQINNSLIELSLEIHDPSQHRLCNYESSDFIALFDFICGY